MTAHGKISLMSFQSLFQSDRSNDILSADAPFMMTQDAHLKSSEAIRDIAVLIATIQDQHWILSVII